MVKAWKEEPQSYHQFKTICIQKHQTIGDVLNKLIRRYVAENQAKE